ncbi:hypothetical protein [Lentibacillus saliphilus]|uniref:hypothetical protein n=1 Tax=Lentibacillus saliphilus TaxID=2737028 RepID=UPI001C300AD9|nr:hypothetical protein [Lentibacillus saliphilus]
MSLGLIVFLIILFIIAVGGTLYAFKQEEKKMEQYEAKGDTPTDELERSHAYETESLKSNIPLQIVIYSLTLIITIIVFVWFIL